MPDQPLTRWLDFLHDLLPPSHIVLVGAGNGSSPWVQWLLQHADAAPTLLLEADLAQYQLLKQRLAHQPEASCLNAVCGLVAPQTGECDFYTASLAAESGLLSPARLSALWPDVQTMQVHPMSATSLQDVFNDLTATVGFDDRHLWLMVDCLPAASLLRGADALLPQLDVVLARVVLSQETENDTPARIEGGHLDEVSQVLQGMRQIALQTTRHPAIAYALFVRDYRAALHHLDLDVRLKKAITSASKQIAAVIGVQHYLDTGNLLPINIEGTAWPVSADFAFQLVTLLEYNDYDLIIEFGSGLSTRVTAHALSTMARHGRQPPAFVSFDHLEPYCQHTRDQLLRAKVHEQVQLHHTPLTDWQAPDGRVQPYYACQPVLAALAEQHAGSQIHLLIVVDGPPATTGKHARYPAWPLVSKYFPDAQVDLLLDDYIRADEKEIVARWEQDIAASGLVCTVTHYVLEKEACLLQIRKPQLTNTHPALSNENTHRLRYPS